MSTPQITLACGAAGDQAPVGVYTKVHGGRPIFNSHCVPYRTPVEDTPALFKILRKTAAGGPSFFVALGQPPHGHEPGTIVRRSSLDPVRQWLLLFDVDGADGLAEDATGAEVVARLPAWLQDCAWIVQKTGQAMTGVGVRRRLWAVLSAPLRTRLLKGLAKSLAKSCRMDLDMAMYGKGLVFTADPIFEGDLVDPVAAAGLPRWELVPGSARLDANLIDPEEYLSREPQGSIPTRPPLLTDQQFRGYLKATFRGMLDDVASARHPHRTETFKTKGVRLTGLCRGLGIDALPLLERLRDRAVSDAFGGKPQPHLDRLVEWCYDCAVPPLYPPHRRRQTR